MLLITGATGNVGRPLVEELLAAGAKVRAVTRDPSKADLPDGVDVVHADLGESTTYAEMLAGVTAIFLNPAAVRASVPALLRAAGEHGVTRVVVLSSGAIRDDMLEQTDPLASWHFGIEAGVRASGLAWTFVRPFEFASNVVTQWGEQIRYTGAVHEPYPDATSAVIHERDIATVAAAALLSDDHDGRTYPITGPESLTRAEMAAVLADAIGRAIEFRTITRDGALKAMVDNGLPEPIAGSVLAMREMSVGHPAPVTDVVEQVTGSPARTFADWARDHANDF